MSVTVITSTSCDKAFPGAADTHILVGTSRTGRLVVCEHTGLASAADEAEAFLSRGCTDVRAVKIRGGVADFTGPGVVLFQ